MAFAGLPGHMFEMAMAARGGLPSDIGGSIDEREEQSAAKARPEKAVDRACKPGSAECIGARRGKIDPHALGSDRPRPEDEQAILPLLDAAAIFAENARALFHEYDPAILGIDVSRDQAGRVTGRSGIYGGLQATGDQRARGNQKVAVRKHRGPT